MNGNISNEILIIQFIFFSLSANQNYSPAQYILGEIYYEGKYIEQDINKAIHYFTLSANQNHSYAQCYLGIIYFLSRHVPHDIDKSIYYLEKAANLNNSDAQFLLGEIYYLDEYVKKDINKSIYYLTLSADQKNAKAQYLLGVICLDNNDITKAIDYITLASDNNIAQARLFLGVIYYENIHVKRNITKSIHYLTLAAYKNNSSIAQYNLSRIYYEFKIDMNKSIYFLLESLRNRFTESYFPVGFLYHSGKYIEKDIHKAIYYYKEASSFYNQYAKNNLGIIYKNGFYDEIQPNLGYAITYFEEAIKQKNDNIAYYNLAHLIIYRIGDDESINKAIRLIEKNISNAKIELSILYLLFIIKIKKYRLDLETIEKDILKITSNPKIVEIARLVKNDFYEINIEMVYEEFSKIDFLYDYDYNHIFTNNIFQDSNKQNPMLNSKIHDITLDFYEGFGVDFI